MGIHGASAGGYNWPWYGKLVGAIFNGHPVQQFATFNVIDKKIRPQGTFLKAGISKRNFIILRISAMI
jgi:hypothetical protein